MRLADWLKNEDGMDQRRFASAIGVHPISVSKYATGRTVPRPDVAARIEQATGGKVTSNDLVAAYRERASACAAA